jgi:cellulose biosynthesis protein BcsQ
LRVFISYAQADTAFVKQTIKPRLERHGIEVWCSEEHVRAGENWDAAVRGAIRSADWFLLVLSPQAEQSERVRAAARWAVEDKPNRLLPVRLGPCNLTGFPDPLRGMQSVDFSTDLQVAGDKLLSDILGQLTRETRQLSDERQKLKSQVTDLRLEQAKVRAQIANMLAFDGTWTQPIPPDVAPFKPLVERKARIIAVTNLKGGVGKTTLTANIGAALWSGGSARRVLVIDLDYQANLTQCCLDKKTIQLLRTQNRLAHTLFGDGPPTADDLTHCLEPILDDRQRGTKGFIVPSDDDLAVSENRAVMRWLAGQGAGDVRFRLRSMLHDDKVQWDYDVILLDCPPRLTTACINALSAADFVLVPVLLDERSTEGAPRLLRWLQARRETLFHGLRGVGVVANKVKGVAREEEVWEDLVTDCGHAWQGDICWLPQRIPLFTEPGMAKRFPASYKGWRETFTDLANQMISQIDGTAGGQS